MMKKFFCRAYRDENIIVDLFDSDLSTATAARCSPLLTLMSM
jgi:hypothetical protein